MVKILVGLADKADAKLAEISGYLADQQMKAMDAEEGEKLALYVAKKKLGNQDIDYEPVRESGRLVGLTSFNKAAFNTASFLLSSSVIDVLRIGEGFEKFRRGEGGVLALGEDAVRALIVVNAGLKAAAKLGPKVRTLIGMRAAVDASNGTLPNCGYVFAARASRLSGQSLFATIDDIGKAPGGARTVDQRPVDHDGLEVRARPFRVADRNPAVLAREDGVDDAVACQRLDIAAPLELGFDLVDRSRDVDGQHEL